MHQHSCRWRCTLHIYITNKQSNTTTHVEVHQCTTSLQHANAIFAITIVFAIVIIITIANMFRHQGNWGSRATLVPGGKGMNSYVEIRPRSKKQEGGKKEEKKVEELINIGSDSSDSDINHLLVPQVEIISSDDD